MKVLIIGDSGSVFVKQYIENVMLDIPNVQIVLIQENPFLQYLDFYKSNNVIVEPLVFNKNKWIFKIPVIRSFLGIRIWCNKIKKSYGNFDIIHIHGLNRSRGNIGLYLRKITKKLVISIWGDEVFRINKKNSKRHKKYYDMADIITVSTKAMLNRFTYLFGKGYNHKITMNKFAIGIFDKIDNIKQNFSREELCQYFNIASPNKTIVFVGHNGREAQRHFELTNCLASLPKSDLDKIVLVYTLTYGVKDTAYINDLEKQVQALGCEYVILRDFLDEDSCAKLRVLCDVLLHAQLTDAFSASIQESLFSGSVILNGSWLPYEELPQYSDCYIEYDNIDDIPGILHEVIENFDNYKSKYSCNREILKNLSSTEVTTKAWKKSLGL